MSPSPQPDEKELEFVASLAHTNKIKAIQWLREKKGLDLKGSKDFVNSLVPPGR